MRDTELSRAVVSISPAMKGIFDRHFAAVWRFMSLRGVRQPYVDDLVHAVFRVVREHPTRREEADVSAILIYMVCRQVLRQSSHASVICEASALAWGEDATAAPSGSSARDALRAALEPLTHDERDVYLMCDVERVPASEVSEILGIAERSVERKLAVVRRLMAEHSLRLGRLVDQGAARESWERRLAEAALVAASPSKCDRQRVFAAMIAESLKRLEAVPRSGDVPRAGKPARLELLEAASPPPPDSEQVMSAGDTGNPSVTYGPALLWGIALGSVLLCGLTGYWVSAGTSHGRLSVQPAAAKDREARPILAARTHELANMTPGETVATRAIAHPSTAEADADSASSGVPAAATADSPPHDEDALSREATISLREARQLFSVERSYMTGGVDGAANLLKSHRRRFPASPLALERAGLEARILCSQGKYREAWRVLLELEARKGAQAAAAALAARRACRLSRG